MSNSNVLKLGLPAGSLQEAANATLATGLVRPLSPPAEQAETWFERASEWEGTAYIWILGKNGPTRPRHPRPGRPGHFGTLSARPEESVRTR